MNKIHQFLQTDKTHDIKTAYLGMQLDWGRFDKADILLENTLLMIKER